MSDFSSYLSTRNKQWSAKLWDGFIEAVSARLAPLEEQLDIQKEVADAIVARGLTVIEQELAPIVEQADQILDESTASINAKLARFEQKVTGGTVISMSNSSATLANDATVNITLIPADREFFAPTPFLAISRASTVANWAIAKVNSFNRSTGVLSVTFEQVNGAGGPYSDWIITSLPGATLLQKAYYEQTLALRQQVGSDKIATGEDRAATLSHRNAANDAAALSVSARDRSEAAYANLRQAVAEPIVPPVNPVLGQLWWDGLVTRLYDGVGYVPTVTTSIGGRRFERGTFGPASDGVIIVGGGFTFALVFINGRLIREGEDYTPASPTITVHAPHEGDEYFVEAYLATDATDYDTKEQVNQKIVAATTGAALKDAPVDADAVVISDSADGGKSKRVLWSKIKALVNMSSVGAAMAAANGKTTPADGDFFSGVEAGGTTMFKATWFNIKAALQTLFDSRYLRLIGGTITGPLITLYPRDNSNVGERNYSPAHTMRIGNSSLEASFFAEERVGTDVRAVISARSGTNISYLAFTHWGDIEIARNLICADVRATGWIYSGTATFRTDGNLFGSKWNALFGNFDAAEGLNARIEARSFNRTRDYMLSEAIPVGGYAMLRYSGTAINPQSVGGGELQWSNSNGDISSPLNYGTFQPIGTTNTASNAQRTTIWKRIG